MNWKLEVTAAIAAGALGAIAATLFDVTGLYDYETWEIAACFPCGAVGFFLSRLLISRVGGK